MNVAANVVKLVGVLKDDPQRVMVHTIDGSLGELQDFSAFMSSCWTKWRRRWRKGQVAGVVEGNKAQVPAPPKI